MAATVLEANLASLERRLDQMLATMEVAMATADRGEQHKESEAENGEQDGAGKAQS